MEQNCNNIVDIHYQQTGEASATNELGMREMQAKAFIFLSTESGFLQWNLPLKYIAAVPSDEHRRKL